MSAAAAVKARQGPRLVIADVALFYGERSGGIKTYLDEKSRFAELTGAFEHHTIIPGRRESHRGGRHRLRALRLVASNGYRVPLGAGAVKQTLREIQPDVVMLHDPFWRPLGVTSCAHELGARVIAVHHSSVAMSAAGLPGPDAIYKPLLKRIYTHAYGHVDAVMSVVDPRPCSGRHATLPLRLGLDPAFRPGPGVPADHVLYAGRLAWEKGVFDLLEAMAAGHPDRPLWLVGDGPARRPILARAARLGVTGRMQVRPFISDRRALARAYREAACVVMPGPHETFGLVALEAAASGARVVASDAAPSAHLARELCETFAAGDAGELSAAIDRALNRRVDLADATALAERLSWESVLSDELHDLERLVQ